MKYFANLLVVLLAISLCLPVVAHAQETTVTVPDENLAAALRNSLELGANAPITQEALEGFTRLILSSRNITNLTGLEYATNLASLDLGDNNISDVTPLAGLTDLTTLYLAGNNITDFSPLLSLTTLQTVDVDFSALWMPDAALRSIARHALDLSEGEHLTIAKMANLTSFAVSYTTSVADLTGLEYATNLTELFFTVIHAGGFTDLSPIADLTGITTFLLAAAQVTDLTPLAGMVNMEKLNLQQNGDNISDITPLQGMVNLKELNLYENNISDLSPLKDLRDLEILHLSQNNVSEVSGLEGLVSLKRLSLEENNISDVSPLQGVVNLKVLTLSENNISDLSPLKDLRDLEVLYLSQNNVTDISALEGLVNLKSLRLKENNISDVSPLAGLWDLTNLLLEGNPIIDTSPLYPLTLSNLTQTDIDIFQYAPLDVNQDGSVDNIDVGLVVAALGQTGDGIENLRTDVNGDGSVDNADLMLIDGEAPGVTVSVPSLAQNKAFDITIVFSEVVSGFEKDDISLSDSTTTARVTSLTATDDITYTATITPIASGDVVISIPAGAAMDVATNLNTAAETQTVIVDMDAPSVEISVPSGVQSGAFDFTITFSESVSFLVESDVFFAGSTVSSTITTWTWIDPDTYNGTITPTASGDVVISIPKGTVIDDAVNQNIASETHTVTVDMDAPTVTVSAPTVAQKGAFDITFTFSEAVSGFEQAEVSLADSTATASVGALTTADNIIYTTTVTPTTSGTVSLSIPASVATDVAGNANTASETHTITVDMDAPVPTATVISVPQKGAFAIIVMFSEVVSGFEQTDISLVHSTARASITGLGSGDNISYGVGITPTTSGFVVIDIPAGVATDAAGNPNTASERRIVTIDMDRPTVNVSAPTVAQKGAFDITFTFSEAVSGFEQAEVLLANNTATASVGALTTADNIIYTTTVTPTTSGTVSLRIPAKVATDAAGNANTASERHTITVTMDGPIVSVSTPGIVQKGEFNVVYRFSEVVSGFEQADISLAGSTATVSVGALTTKNNIVYWTIVTPTTSGDLVVSVPAGAATDAAGKENTASETYTVTVDIDAPVPTVIVPMDPQSGAFQVKVTFNELVRWFTDVDQISFSDSTAEYSIPTWGIRHTGIESVDYTYMTINVEPITSGNFVISVPEDVGRDYAGNLSTASGPHTVIIDMDAPTLTVSAPTVAQSGAFDVTITFSEAVSGFEQAEVSLANNTATASVGALTTTDNIIYTTTVTPTTSGTVSLSIPAKVATDAAGNANTASETHTITVSISDGPSVTVSAPTVAQSGAFDVTITFSEAVSGFEQADVSLADSTATASITAWNIVDTTTYTATITPTTSGDVVISIPADVATNAASRMNTASDTHTVTVDMDAPTVRIFTPRNEWNEPVTQSEAFNVRIRFSEAVSGFEPADVSLADSSATATVTSLDTSNNITYTAKITPTASGAVYINILEGVATDAAGNLNTAAYTDTVAVSIPGGDTVDIPDTQLATILRGYLNLTVNQPITTEGLKGLIWLNANTASITDLTGLEHAINLTWVLMTRNNVSDISDLAGLTNLTELYLSDNNVSDISYLAGLTNLTNLALHNNSISDISYLAGLTRLKDLRLHNNSISDISALAGLTDLTWLLLSGNPILDTSPIFPLLEANGGKIKPNLIDISVSQYPPWDVNTDGSVDATDSALVTAALGQIGVDIVNPRTDIDGDGDVDNDDVLLVTNNLDEEVEEDLTNARAPVLLDSAALRNLSPAALEARLAALRAESDGSLKYSQAIALLESVLAELRPDETILLANYPNPFNPETWLPYHLANASDVRITIYDARGSVMRRLELGHQTAGYYTSRSRAAYWDGANEVGERVASGIYFYQLEADNHSFLRKMLILK